MARTIAKEKRQVNVEMDLELIEKLDAICVVEEHSRSQFIRKLIRQEWQRRTEKSVLENQKANSGDAKTI
jgi:metal-responsive CopG/Arc/MetJ family transcriptional regulator